MKKNNQGHVDVATNSMCDKGVLGKCLLEKELCQDLDELCREVNQIPDVSNRAGALQLVESIRQRLLRFT